MNEEALGLLRQAKKLGLFAFHGNQMRICEVSNSEEELIKLGADVYEHKGENGCDLDWKLCICPMKFILKYLELEEAPIGPNSPGNANHNLN